MKSRNRYDEIHPRAVTLIRREAIKLSRHPAFRWTEPADFEQELALHVLDRVRCFDGSRAGLLTFLSQVIRNHAIRMLERETAAIRGGGVNHLSLNDMLMDEDGVKTERIGTISEDQGLWSKAPTWEEAVENRMEAEDLLALLPSELRDVAIRVSLDSITGVSRHTGIPRPTLYDALKRARRIIRKKCSPGPTFFPSFR
ncbi:MAG: sigma-70 family RNA polymerase sigma factor [Magnetococcales bacterium]|nr:sigma-70 family RNA polymerase sigma factor [Magnetococcales bacterium]